LAPAARRSRQAFLRLLSLLLLIYATLGKSGSYIGITLGGGVGIYIGDLALLTGLAVLMVEGGYERCFVLPVALPWLFFFILSAAQTRPYLSGDGLLAPAHG